MAYRALLALAACAMTLDLAHSACTPCDQACAEDGAAQLPDGDHCMCDHQDGKFLPPQKYTCAGGCCSRNLEEGQVGTTKVGGNGETQETDGGDGGDGQGYCTESTHVNASGIDCASFVDKFDCMNHNGACMWHARSHQSTDEGSDQDSDHGDDQDSDKSLCGECASACGQTLGPGQDYCTHCIGGECRAICDAEHGADAVQGHIDAGCQDDSDDSDHEGNTKCGARHNPDDHDCCAPNGEEMFCHDGWVPKRNGKGCGSWVAANEWKEDPNGQFECHRPDERAKYCGEGTEWRGSDHGCVATAEGAIRACERHRGEDWAFTCRPIDTCDDNHGNQYQNHNHGNQYQNPCLYPSEFTPDMPWGAHCTGDELHDGKGNTKDRCENSLKCDWSSQCTDVGDAGYEDCCHCGTQSACEANGAMWQERTCEAPINEHWDWIFGLTCEQETRYGNAGDILRDWGHGCCANHESICGVPAQDSDWVQEFKCRHDNVTKLQADSKGQVMSCERSLCDKNAFAAEGAPTHWYEMTCCATCDFSPKDNNWGVSPVDEYVACAQQHCPLATQWFTNTTIGQAITADPRWSENTDYVFEIMHLYPEAMEGVECACRHCGDHLTEEVWRTGPGVCRALMGPGSPSPSRSPSRSPSSSHWK